MRLLRKLILARVYLLSFLEAGLIAVSYTAAVYLFHPLDAETYLEYEGGGLRIALATLAFLAGSYLFDFYRGTPTRSRLLLGLQLAQLIGIILLIQAALAFLNPDLVLPQPVVLVGSILMLLLLIPWRLFIRPVIWNMFGAQRVLIVGSSRAVDQVIEAFSHEPALGMEVAGSIVPPGTPASTPVLGTPDSFMAVVSKTHPDRIIVAGDIVRDRALVRQLLDLKSLGVSVQTAGQVYESVFGRIDCFGLDPYVVTFLDELEARPGSVALQSIYTNLVGLAAVIIALPFIILITATLKILGRGPALIRMPCAGLHGIPFNMYRFRRSPAGTGDILSRFLTRYNLDGLPQVLNLIRGELSLIGPRADRVEFDNILHEMIPFYRQKQFVKPGIFGWSQLNCDPVEEEDTLKRFEYDLYYIKHISLVLDAYIMLRAIKWILSGRETVVGRDTLNRGIAG